MNSRGFSLLETLVAMFLTTVSVLAVAPMFIHATRANDASADMGSIGAIALDRVEQLTRQPWRDLQPGGSLSADVDGYFSASDQEFQVRWQITDDPTASKSRAITVVVVARDAQIGPRRRVELTVIRGR